MEKYQIRLGRLKKLSRRMNSGLGLFLVIRGRVRLEADGPDYDLGEGGLAVIGTGTGALSQAVVMIMGSLVGGFGIEGASVVQMQITNQLFAPILEVVHMPMELWAVALIAASRITNIIYPSANMIGQMGIARSDNMKSMLKVGWMVAAVTFLFIIVYAFAGAAFLY